jgi:hypothetical protein
MSGFFAGGIRAISSAWEDEAAGVVRAVARLALALPPSFEVEAERLGRLGFKIGLLVRDGQRVERLLASSEPSYDDAQVTSDLQTVFETPAGTRWVGRVFHRPPVPTFPVADIAEYELELVLTGATQLPQGLHAPSRYGNEGSFAESHLTALWVVQPPGRY